MQQRSAALFALLLSYACQPAAAGVTDIFTESFPGGSLPGINTFDTFIDFEGILRGQQLVIQLNQGSIFYEPTGGNIFPPSLLQIGISPESVFGTFVTIGGFTAETSQPVLVAGGAVNLGQSSELVADPTKLSVAWAPGAGVDVANQASFPIARVSISDDARGALTYFGVTDDRAIFINTWLFRHGSVTPIDAIAGDFNFDDRVDNADLNLLLGAWGDEVVPDEWIHSFAGPTVDNGELASLLATWGSVEPPPFAVPEPNAALLVGGVLALQSLPPLPRRARLPIGGTR